MEVPATILPLIVPNVKVAINTAKCIGKKVAPAEDPANTWNILGKTTPNPLNKIVPITYFAFLLVNISKIPFCFFILSTLSILFHSS